jgi:hypothetical protein
MRMIWRSDQFLDGPARWINAALIEEKEAALSQSALHCIDRL